MASDDRKVSTEDLIGTWCDEIINALSAFRDLETGYHLFIPSGHEAYNVWYDALEIELTLEALKGLDETQIVKLRDEFRDFWETDLVECSHIKVAVEGSIWNWSEDDE